MFSRDTANAFGAATGAVHHGSVDDTRKNSDDLDNALQGTFPASDPVTVHSTMDEEKERRRKVLQQDKKRKRRPAARKKTRGKKVARKKKTKPAKKRARKTARRR